MRTTTHRAALSAAMVLLVALGHLAAPPAGADARGNAARPGEVTPSSAVAVSTSGSHTCAVLADGRVKCWGHGGGGTLGLGDTEHRGDEPGEMGDALPAVDLGAGRTATSVVAGSGQTCAILDTGQLKCWGLNFDGNLGLGDTEHRGDEPGEMGDALSTVDLGSGRTALDVAIGAWHTCALLDNGQVKCWGSPLYGTLGLGDDETRGDEPGEMGDALPAVDLGPGRTATAISASGRFTCALLDDGSVKCWGENESGQLGIGDAENRGDQPGEMGGALPTVDLGTGRTAVAVEAGDFHACAILDDGTVKCWGQNDYHVTLGLGWLGGGLSSYAIGDQPGEMGDALPAVDLGPGRTVESLSASFTTCALLDTNRVKCWGDNFYGQLGVGDDEPRGDNGAMMGAALPAVDLGPGRTATAVTAGGTSTCARIDDGRIRCWGDNEFGQLGVGNTRHRGSDPADLGNNLGWVHLFGAGPARCHGRRATVEARFGDLASSGADVVVGSAGADVIEARGGDDLVCAEGGRDTIVGGGGGDRIFGGEGADPLRGGADPDLLDGGPGADRLEGGPSAFDQCFGGPGVDSQTGCERRIGVP